jgi:opacity protein-like surface antigen
MVESGAKGDVMVRQIGLAAALVVLVLGLGAVVWAQEADGGCAGRKEIVFTFDQWYLGAYGGGIGMRYFLRDDVAIRPALSLRLSNDTDDELETGNQEGDGWVPQRNYTYDSDKTTVGLSIVAEKYLAEFHDVVPLVGLGLGYAYSSEDNHNKRRSYYRDGYTFESTRTMVTGHSGSLIGLVGVQWRLRDNVSLGGEYEIVASLGRSERTQTTTAETENGTTFRRDHRKSTASSLDFESGRLLLAVRF